MDLNPTSLLGPLPFPGHIPQQLPAKANSKPPCAEAEPKPSAWSGLQQPPLTLSTQGPKDPWFKHHHQKVWSTQQMNSWLLLVDSDDA